MSTTPIMTHVLVTEDWWVWVRPEQFPAGAHNDIRVEGKGRRMQRPHKRLKFENVLTVVPLLFLACTQTCINTWTETPQRTKKEKSQYQDTICSEEEEGNGDRPWEVLYDSTEITFPSAFLVSDCWDTYPSALTDTICVLNDLCYLASTVVSQWSNTRANYK